MYMLVYVRASLAVLIIVLFKYVFMATMNLISFTEELEVFKDL